MSHFFKLLALIFLIQTGNFISASAQSQPATPDISLESNPPQILSIQIKIVPEPHWTLFIYGNNFGGNSGIVSLNQEKKEILLWTNNEIQAKVLSSTKSGNLELETADVQKISLKFSFDINPTISSIFPLNGYEGALITVYGYEFGNQKGNVFINGQSVEEISSWSEYEIKFVIPQNTSSGMIQARTALAEDTNEFPIQITKRPPPEVQYIFPNSAFKGDTVTIYGKYFGTNLGEIKLGAEKIVPISWKDSEISFIVPENAQNGDLTIITSGLSSETIPFTINVQPQIFSIEPFQIIPGLTKVTIKGVGFKDHWYTGSNIYFSDIVSEFILEWNDSKIVAIPPSNVSAGTIKLKIVNVPSIIQGPSYTIKTVVAHISPKSGKIGEKIEIIGENFGESKGSVSISDIPAEIISWENRQIEIIIPFSATTGLVKIIKTNGAINEDFTFTVLPTLSDDPKSHHQWYLDKVGAPNSWNISTGDSEIVVAIIDEGVDTNHPDLSQNIWINPGETIGNFRDDDQNGYIDDFNGWNFIVDSNEMTPLGPHGTMVAGIIGAIQNNQIGISGVSPKVKIMPLIVCRDGDCLNFKVKDAIRYATKNGADIINLSLGGAHFTNTYSEEYNEAINEAFNQGIIIVAAAGNGDLISSEGRNLNLNPTSPACNDLEQNMVIGVAALNQNDKKTNWSDYGSNCVDISAPGLEILTTVPPKYDSDFDPSEDITLFGYTKGSGTSFAAPLVSAAAVLLKSIHPDWNIQKIRDTLIETADPIDDQNPNFKGQIGKKLNIHNALAKEPPSKSNSQKTLPKPTPKTDSQTIKINQGFSNLRNTEVIEGKLGLEWDPPLDLRAFSHYQISYKTDLDDKWSTYSDNLGNPIKYPRDISKVEIQITYQLKYTYKVELVTLDGKVGGTLVLEVNLRPIPKNFSDLISSHRNFKAINYLKSRRILEGYPDGTFRPQSEINRAELIKVLVTAKKINPEFDIYKNCFPDVTDEWFARFVCYGKKQGWIQGYPDGTFKPAQTVNKVEAIKILINSQGILIPYLVSKAPYNDIPLNAWFTPYIKAAKDLNLLEETGALFKGSDPMVRASISENIYRALLISQDKK